MSRYWTIPRTPSPRIVKAALTAIDGLALSFNEGEAFHPGGL